MIHDRPICFDCTTRIDTLDDTIFASPFFDDDPRAPTAAFHPLCLMRWRERRDVIVESIVTHFRGECPHCQLHDEDEEEFG